MYHESRCSRYLIKRVKLLPRLKVSKPSTAARRTGCIFLAVCGWCAMPLPWCEESDDKTTKIRTSINKCSVISKIHKAEEI